MIFLARAVRLMLLAMLLAAAATPAQARLIRHGFGNHTFGRSYGARHTARFRTPGMHGRHAATYRHRRAAPAAG